MNRLALLAAALASIAATACGGAERPSEPQHLVMQASDAAVSMSPIVAGDTSVLTITNNHPTLTLVHGGFAARIDIWQGWAWAILIPPPNGAMGEALLVKREPIYLAPGESLALEVDAASKLAPGEHDLSMELGFMREATGAYVGGLRPAVRLVVSAPPES